MNKIFFCLLILLSSVYLISSNGSSKFQIGNELYDNLFKVVTQKVIIEANKYKENLPPINLDLSPAKFLPIKLNITNLKFEDLLYRDDEFEISANEATKIISIKLNKVNLKASTDYSEKVLFLKRKGDISLDLDFSFELYLKYHLSQDNFLQLTLDSFSVNHHFNKLEIEGQLLLNLLAKNVNIFNKVINWGLKKGLTPVIKMVIEKLNTLLKQEINIPQLKSLLIVKFLEEPLFTEDYFELDIDLDFIENSNKNLEFLQTSSIAKKLFKSVKLDLDAEIKDQIKVSIEESLMNDFASVALKDLRNIKITNDIIPKEIPFKINTLYFQAFIPEMYEKFPNKDLIINIDLDSYPIFNLDSPNELLNAYVNLSLSFAVVDDPEVSILTVSLAAGLGLKFDSEKDDNAIHFTIDKVQIKDAIVVSSILEDISADTMKDEMNSFFTSFLYFVNNYLRLNPIKIPALGGFSLEKINISVVENKFLEVRLKPDLNNLKNNK